MIYSILNERKQRVYFSDNKEKMIDIIQTYIYEDKRIAVKEVNNVIYMTVLR